MIIIFKLNFSGSGGVELSLDPSELEGLDSESMAARYEQTLREQQGNLAKEDFSDMVAEHAAKQKVSRKSISVFINLINKMFS